MLLPSLRYLLVLHLRRLVSVMQCYLVFWELTLSGKDGPLGLWALLACLLACCPELLGFSFSEASVRALACT